MDMEGNEMLLSAERSSGKVCHLSILESQKSIAE